ncbi:MAG: RDD family protein [Wolbachia endosymbiont of Tyrophagus putrescentiae]|nr:RDD family protein [Wolbachia endosymbiont of Tyrophagus putrescentiae]
MDIKANYARITKRVAAYIVDQTIFLVCCSSFFLLILFILPEEPPADFFNYVFPDNDIDTGLVSKRYEILKDPGTLLESLLYIALEVLMITRLGWTPGKLLFGIYIKDASTLKNAALMQVIMRSSLKALLFIMLYISEWFLILPILVLIFAAFNKFNQSFYDKIANTVVIEHQSEKCYLNSNYAGIARRVMAHIIDSLVIIGISLISLIFIGIIFHIAGSKLFIKRTYLSFLLSIVFGVFMIRKFGGTPGQLLSGIHIKDADTFENITLVQAIIRHVLVEIIRFPILITRREIFNKYTSEWWLDPFSGLIFMTMMLIFVYAIFDQRKQFLHDKIARTVAIEYKPLS